MGSESEQQRWERILSGQGLSMNRGKSRWLLSTDNTDLYQRGRDASQCSTAAAIKRSRKPHKPHKPHKPISPVSCTCQVCGHEFAGYHADAQYCSVACKQKAYRKRALPKNIQLYSEGTETQ